MSNLKSNLYMYIRHEDKLTDITVDAPEQTTFNPLFPHVDLSMVNGPQSIINVFIIIVFKPSIKCIITKNKNPNKQKLTTNTSENVEKEEKILTHKKIHTLTRALTHMQTHRTEFGTFDQELFTHTYIHTSISANKQTN